MNTGIMDAHNLASKLALVAHGGASEELPNTYEQERRPVAGNVLGLSDAIVRWHHMNHPVKRALRDALVPAITRLPAVQRRATRRLSQISVAYPSSPLCRGRHVLLVSALDVSTRLESASLSAYNDFVEVVVGRLGTGPHHKSRHGTFALVRPDGFLAARGVGNDVEKVMDYLRVLLRRTDANPGRSVTTALARGI